MATRITDKPVVQLSLHPLPRCNLKEIFRGFGPLTCFRLITTVDNQERVFMKIFGQNLIDLSTLQRYQINYGYLANPNDGNDFFKVYKIFEVDAEVSISQNKSEVNG